MGQINPDVIKEDLICQFLKHVRSWVGRITTAAGVSRKGPWISNRFVVWSKGSNNLPNDWEELESVAKLPWTVSVATPLALVETLQVRGFDGEGRQWDGFWRDVLLVFSSWLRHHGFWMFDGRKFKGKLEMMIMMFLWPHICSVAYILVWGGRFYHSQKKINETDRVKLQPQSLTDNKDKNCRGKQFKESILRDLPDFLGWVINICFEQIVIITWFRHVGNWHSFTLKFQRQKSSLLKRWCLTSCVDVNRSTVSRIPVGSSKTALSNTNGSAKKACWNITLVFKMVMLHFCNWTEMQFHFVLYYIGIYLYRIA